MIEWRIILTDGLNEAGQAILRAAARVEDRNDISPEDLLKEVRDYDAMIVRGRTIVTPEVFDAARRLKVVGRAGVGVDNINLTAASAHGITVVNAPVSTSLAVAELTLGLMLALAREIPYADARMKAGQWVKNQIKGIELNGKTLGVMGMGNIGSAVSQRAAALGMQVIGYDPLIPADKISQYGAEPVSLPNLYARSEFITLHLPLTDETRGMINEQVLGQMKRGVRLVCTARGGMIDETALMSALNSGQVAAVALDVYAKEPPGLTALITHPQVIATPHIGAQTAEAQVHAATDIASEVLNALSGQPLRWKIV